MRKHIKSFPILEKIKDIFIILFECSMINNNLIFKLIDEDI